MSAEPRKCKYKACDNVITRSVRRGRREPEASFAKRQYCSLTCAVDEAGERGLRKNGIGR